MLTRRLALSSPILWSWPAAAKGFTIETLMAAMAQVGERRATFRETRRFAALEAALESRGHLLYRPGYLEKVTDWPVPERLEVSSDRLVITAGNDAPRVIDLAMIPQLRAVIDAIRGPLTGDAAGLNRAFTVTLTGTEREWALDLVPREPGAAKVLRSVRLEGRGDAVGRITLTQANGDDQVMVITPAEERPTHPPSPGSPTR